MIIGLFDEPCDFSMSINVEFYCILFYGVTDEFLSINPIMPNLHYFIMVYLVYLIRLFHLFKLSFYLLKMELCNHFFIHYMNLFLIGGRLTSINYF